MSNRSTVLSEDEYSVEESDELSDEVLDTVEENEKEQSSVKKVEKKVKGNYIDNEKLTKSIVAYLEAKKTNPKIRMPDEIGKAIILIANNLASRYNFMSYTYRDEMVSDGILRAVEVLQKFNPEKGTAFNFLSWVMFNTFVQRIKKEKRERALRDNLIMVVDLADYQESDNQVVKDKLLNSYNFNSNQD